MNDKILKSDAVVCLEGDGFVRLRRAAEIFKKGLAKFIVISGGLKNPPFSIPAGEMAEALFKKRIPKQKIILEEKSQNTREQALGVMKIAKKRKWKRIILVASDYHQLRAFMTFLKAMKDLNLKILIFNAPVRGKITSPKSYEDELRKIEEYKKRGHLVSFKELKEYQKWKERKK